MRINNLKSGVLTLVTILFLTSCSNNEELDTSAAIPVADVQDIVLADDITESLDNILEDDDTDFSLLGKGVASSKSSIADCVTRTFVDNGTSMTITLDFGDSCIGYHGLEFSGKVIIAYTGTTTGYNKSLSFVDFTVEGNRIDGSKSVVKVIENTNGNREATHTVDLTFTSAAGETVSLTGTRVREMIAGADTLNRGDDVYSISGNWEYVSKDGVIFTGTIIENLRREFACRYIVSGITEITRDSEVYTLNFGDGSCDNIGIISDANGNSKEISLRR